VTLGAKQIHGKRYHNPNEPEPNKSTANKRELTRIKILALIRGLKIFAEKAQN